MIIQRIISAKILILILLFIRLILIKIIHVSYDATYKGKRLKYAFECTSWKQIQQSDKDS